MKIERKKEREREYARFLHNIHDVWLNLSLNIHFDVN